MASTVRKSSTERSCWPMRRRALARSWQQQGWLGERRMAWERGSMALSCSSRQAQAMPRWQWMSASQVGQGLWARASYRSFMHFLNSSFLKNARPRWYRICGSSGFLLSARLRSSIALLNSRTSTNTLLRCIKNSMLCGQLRRASFRQQSAFSWSPSRRQAWPMPEQMPGLRLPSSLAFFRSAMASSQLWPSPSRAISILLRPRQQQTSAQKGSSSMARVKSCTALEWVLLSWQTSPLLSSTSRSSPSSCRTCVRLSRASLSMPFLCCMRPRWQSEGTLEGSTCSAFWKQRMAFSKSCSWQASPLEWQNLGFLSSRAMLRSKSSWLSWVRPRARQLLPRLQQMRASWGSSFRARLHSSRLRWYSLRWQRASPLLLQYLAFWSLSSMALLKRSRARSYCWLSKKAMPRLFWASGSFLVSSQARSRSSMARSYSFSQRQQLPRWRKALYRPVLSLMREMASVQSLMARRNSWSRPQTRARLRQLKPSLSLYLMASWKSLRASLTWPSCSSQLPRDWQQVLSSPSYLIAMTKSQCAFWNSLSSMKQSPRAAKYIAWVLLCRSCPVEVVSCVIALLNRSIACTMSSRSFLSDSSYRRLKLIPSKYASEAFFVRLTTSFTALSFFFAGLPFFASIIDVTLARPTSIQMYNGRTQGYWHPEAQHLGHSRQDYDDYPFRHRQEQAQPRHEHLYHQGYEGYQQPPPYFGGYGPQYGPQYAPQYGPQFAPQYGPQYNESHTGYGGFNIPQFEGYSYGYDYPGHFQGQGQFYPQAYEQYYPGHYPEQYPEQYPQYESRHETRRAGFGHRHQQAPGGARLNNSARRLRTEGQVDSILRKY